MSVYILPGILFLCTVLAVMIQIRIHRKKDNLTRTKLTMAPAGLFLVITCLCLSLIAIAEQKGMQKTASVSDFLNGFLSSPIEDTLPEDLGNTLVVYYRYDCPDCHAVMQDVKQALVQYPVSYVCSRSDQGQTLLEQYPVSYVPTIVYITENPAVYYSFPLATSRSDSEVVLNQSGLDQILALYQRHNQSETKETNP